MNRQDKFFLVREDRMLGNKYELLECLGDGSYGWVWRVRRTSDDAIVAIKIPKEQGARNSDLAEGSLLVNQVSHENVVEVYWMGRVPPENDWYVIEMQYFPSETLAQLLDKSDKRFAASYRRVFDIYQQVLEGVAYLHSIKMAHGDIKPQNILVSGDQVKITDFGSSILPEEMYARTRHNGGTILYSAPEVVGTITRKNKSEDYFKADIYSLGVLLYHLVTSQLPHDTLSQVARNLPFPRPREINTSASPALEDFILRSLACDPDKRWAAVNEMISALRKVRQAQLDYQPIRILVPRKELTEDWSSQAVRLLSESAYVEAENVAHAEFQSSHDAHAFLLMITAAFQDERYFDCLREIDSHPEMLSDNSSIANDLRGIRMSSYIETRNIDEAMRVVDEGLERESDNPSLLLKKASLLGLQARYKEASEILLTLNRRFPGRPEIQKRLVLAFDQLRDVGKAAAFLKAYLKQEPNDLWAISKLNTYDLMGIR